MARFLRSSMCCCTHRNGQCVVCFADGVLHGLLATGSLGGNDEPSYDDDVSRVQRVGFHSRR